MTLLPNFLVNFLGIFLINNIFVDGPVFKCSVQKEYLLITSLINLLILFKWTLLEKSLRSLLRSLVIESLIDNIFVERLGFRSSDLWSLRPSTPRPRVLY